MRALSWVGALAIAVGAASPAVAQRPDTLSVPPTRVPAAPETQTLPALPPTLSPTARPPANRLPADGRTASPRPAVVAPVDTAASRTARAAVTRALLVPGLGQLYNGQPVKAPIAAALVVGAVAFAVNRQQQYTTYRRATVFAGCRANPGVVVNPETGAVTVTSPDRVELCTETAPDYQDEWEELGSRPFANVRPIRDRARGQRDVAVLIVAVTYAVQALDAYVFAKLSDFDVSEDVAVGLAPGLGTGPPTLSVRVAL